LCACALVRVVASDWAACVSGSGLLAASAEAEAAADESGDGNTA